MGDGRGAAEVGRLWITYFSSLMPTPPHVGQFATGSTLAAVQAELTRLEVREAVGTGCLGSKSRRQ